MLAMVIASVNRSGSLYCSASLCQLANNCIGFSGGSAINDRFDASIVSHRETLTQIRIGNSASFKYTFTVIIYLHNALNKWNRDNTIFDVIIAQSKHRLVYTYNELQLIRKSSWEQMCTSYLIEHFHLIEIVKNKPLGNVIHFDSRSIWSWLNVWLFENIIRYLWPATGSLIIS